jgi:hypothetical protein
MHGYNVYIDVLVVLVELRLRNQGRWLCGEKRNVLLCDISTMCISQALRDLRRAQSGI